MLQRKTNANVMSPLSRWFWNLDVNFGKTFIHYFVNNIWPKMEFLKLFIFISDSVQVFLLNAFLTFHQF